MLQSCSSRIYHVTTKPVIKKETFKCGIYKSYSRFPEVPEENRDGAVEKSRSDDDRTEF